MRCGEARRRAPAVPRTLPRGLRREPDTARVDEPRDRRSGGRTGGACARRRRRRRGALQRLPGDASGVAAVRSSSSLRGVAWQKRTRPRPSTVSSIVAGQAPIAERWASSSCARHHASRSVRSAGSAARTSRSQFPARNRAPTACSRSTHSPGNGPQTTSPPTTISSTPMRSSSASTASSAGRLPWTS